MTRRRMLKAGRGRVAAVIAAAAGMLAAGATGAIALTGAGGTPGQWSMAGQNIDDTHFQAAEHEISPANVDRLDVTGWEPHRLVKVGISAVPEHVIRTSSLESLL